ncbi:hypothetical protein TNIN_311651 [Trichonephila inaurata madagascariensis]|uniref:Uncharacterized protein n=1 Tax=Trichonephila inaurata madagascariensis TaxID=2747483 RepID=A0A8X6WVR8_9ARAC|nr:hypothetical protein TNIN_311651 [Trichonephila inaurata madagascariensis]
MLDRNDDGMLTNGCLHGTVIGMQTLPKYGYRIAKQEHLDWGDEKSYSISQNTVLHTSTLVSRLTLFSFSLVLRQRIKHCLVGVDFYPVDGMCSGKCRHVKSSKLTQGHPGPGS